MVLPLIGIVTIPRLAMAFPFRTASGITIAFPIPAPTWPAPFPTTTKALNLSRLPPLTTLAILRV